MPPPTDLRGYPVPVYPGYTDPNNPARPIYPYDFPGLPENREAFLTVSSSPSSAPTAINVKDAPYSAKGDTFGVQDAVTNAGSAVVTSPGNGFANAVVGQGVVIQAAGASGAGFVSTIVSKQSSGQITLAAPVTTTIASNAKMSIGTDDTAAIQAAINAAAFGIGVVVVPTARYYTTGVLLLPGTVVLRGAVPGPTDAVSEPAIDTWGATFLITNTVSPFITAKGNCGIEDLIFTYPAQVNSNVGTPVVYPATIASHASGAPALRVRRCFMPNTYKAIDLTNNASRFILEDLTIGCLRNGIIIDHNYDTNFIRNIHFGPWWNQSRGGTFPTALDTYVQNNSVCFLIQRVDYVEITEIEIEGYYVGISFQDSYDGAISGDKCGTSHWNNIVMDGVSYGILCQSTQLIDTTINNLVIGSVNQQFTNCIAVYTQTGGSQRPNLTISNWYSFGPKQFHVYHTAGSLTIRNSHFQNVDTGGAAIYVDTTATGLVLRLDDNLFETRTASAVNVVGVSLTPTFLGNRWGGGPVSSTAGMTAPLVANNV